MDAFVPGAVIVGHENGDIITGITDVVIDKQLGTVLRDVGAHGMEQLSRGANVAADGADIRFYNTESDFHDRTSLMGLSLAISFAAAVSRWPQQWR